MMVRFEFLRRLIQSCLFTRGTAGTIFSFFLHRYQLSKQLRLPPSTTTNLTMPTIVDGKEGGEHYTLSLDDGDVAADAAMESTESREPTDDDAIGVKESGGYQPKDGWEENNGESKGDNNKEFEYDEDNDEYKPDDTSDVNLPSNNDGTGDHDEKIGKDVSDNEKEEDGDNNKEFDKLGNNTMAWKKSTVDLGDIVTDSSEKASFSNDAGMHNITAATKPSSFRNQKQDVFVKKGARVKSILATALQAMADGFTSNAALADLGGDATGGEKTDNECDSLVGSSSGEVGESKKSWNARTDFAHVRDLAQEKTEECMALKRVSTFYSFYLCYSVLSIVSDIPISLSSLLL